MAYDRYEARRGWREPRSRFGEDFRERNEDRYGRGFDRDVEGREDRGFFERAGDEVASWFGDEEAERRRREDARMQERRPSATMDAITAGTSRANLVVRALRATRTSAAWTASRGSATKAIAGPTPAASRAAGSVGGDEDRFDRGYPPERGWSERWERARQREFTGTASGLHDPHYSEWRRRQIDALDRDYDEYRRENQNRFENEFSSWRTDPRGQAPAARQRPRAYERRWLRRAGDRQGRLRTGRPYHVDQGRQRGRPPS